MTAEGHLVFALASAILAKNIVFNSTLTYSSWLYIIVGSVTACLLPDMDHPKSVLGRKFKMLSKIISFLCGHRGFTHSILAVIILSCCIQILLATLIPLDFIYGLIIGYCSHIVADMLTPFGVPLLWPCRWKFGFPCIFINAIKKRERIICITLLFFAIIYPYMYIFGVIFN